MLRFYSSCLFGVNLYGFPKLLVVGVELSYFQPVPLSGFIQLLEQVVIRGHQRSAHTNKQHVLVGE